MSWCFIVLFDALLQGLFIGLSLIVAIGPQNAFLINQGLKRQHVFFCASFCIISDVILVSAGIFGIGSLFQSHPLLIEIARWFGAVFLFFYWVLSFKSALKPQALKQSDLQKPMVSRKKIAATLFALTFLNPHAYLDTLVLIGSISAQFPGQAHYFFGIGAIIASVLWFFSLVYAAKLLTPLFKNPKAWQCLDVIIGIIMWCIAFGLIYPVLF